MRRPGRGDLVPLEFEGRGIEHPRFDGRDRAAVIQGVQVEPGADPVVGVVEARSARAHHIERAGSGAQAAATSNVQVAEEHQTARHAGHRTAECLGVDQPTAELLQSEPRIDGTVVDQEDRGARRDLGPAEDGLQGL